MMEIFVSRKKFFSELPPLIVRLYELQNANMQTRWLLYFSISQKLIIQLSVGMQTPSSPEEF